MYGAFSLVNGKVMGSGTELEGKVERRCKLFQALGDSSTMGSVECIVVRVRVVLPKDTLVQKLLHRL